jgi:ABC-type sugar transport system ATPase subunit
VSQAKPTLEAREVRKRYGHTDALDGVDLTVTAGEVHGLVGHNGAGKSTLLRILAGAERADSGSLVLEGVPLHVGSPREAIDRGISCVYQELSIIENLTVAQNLFLGRELRTMGLRLDIQEMERQAAAFLREFGLDVPPGQMVRELTVARRQLIEVATALHRNARFLLLDEPTTALEASQIQDLLRTVRRVADERGVGVLLIDHKLDEVYTVADRVTALRNGRVILSGPTAEVHREAVVSAIVGVEASAGAGAGLHGPAPAAAVPGRAPTAGGPGEPALVVKGLRSPHLRGVSLVARTGRVLGIYGLVGAGRTDFLCALYGVEPVEGGEIQLFGHPYRPRNPAAAMRAGISYLSEERKADGFVPRLTAVSNVTLPVLERYTRLSVLSLRKAAAAARAALGSVDVKGDVEGAMEDLSGGNQQKVLFARTMLQRPRLLLLDEPTKGVDIGAKREIYGIVRSFVSDPGVAAVVVSSEEEEILTLADDVVVFNEGSCSGEVYQPQALQPGDLRRLAWTHERGTAAASSSSRVPLPERPRPGPPRPGHR